ncbi:hypothetical protein AMST5_01626 [freshwater sediment metagenome]|uniref:Sulfur globule protein n=1 Tax=freshwater sediment metagenome TaxID=556182 RepID=A0AA48RDU8_9ZZZZ
MSGRKFSLVLALGAALALPSAALAGPHGGGGHGGGGGGWGGHYYRGGGARWWGGRWWPYGVGSCWRWNPYWARWVWVCY